MNSGTQSQNEGNIPTAERIIAFLVCVATFGLGLIHRFFIAFALRNSLF